MGVDTLLWLNPRWQFDDVIDVINHHVIPDVFHQEDVKAEVVFCQPVPGMLIVTFCGRQMYVHLQSSTPLGPAMRLSLGHNEQAVEIMKTIAGVLGGALEKDDCSEEVEFIRGRFWEEDGLTYHLKYAVIHERHSGMSTKSDVEALEGSIQKWYDKHDNSRRR